MNRRWWVFIFGLCVVLSMGVMTFSTTQAQGNLVWTAQYFNNSTLSGSPAVTTNFNNLNINWGTGSPGNGIGGDNWTARFNTVASFNAGTYRFSINGDDAVRLYVHGALLLDTFNNPQPNKVQTVDYTFTAGNAGIQIDYRKYVGDAFLYVSWQQVGVTNPSPVPPQTNPGGLWQAVFYNNTSLSGAATAITSYNDLNVNWGNNAPIAGVGADNWTARFYGSPYIAPGRYRFNINADDALRLYVQNQLVLDTFINPQPDRWLSVDVTITGGYTPIQIDYREYIGPAFVYFGWQPIVTTQPTPVPQPPVVNAPTVIVNTPTLNFRSAPVITDNVLARLSQGSRYPVIGRTAGSDWYQIQVNGTAGWVAGRYVIPSNVTTVPVVNPQPSQPPVVTGYTLSPRVNLSIRSGPGTNYRRLTVLPRFQTVSIVGRTGNNTWWEIVYGNTRGWVSGAYVTLPSNINVANIPVR